MLSSAPIVGFVLTSDSGASRAFYIDKLGMEFVDEDEFALVLRCGGNIIRASKTAKFEPARHTVLGWVVEDLEATAHWLTDRGVELQKYPWIQDPSGIMTFPNGSKVAWFTDPDGNVLSISSH